MLNSIRERVTKIQLATSPLLAWTANQRYRARSYLQVPVVCTLNQAHHPLNMSSHLRILPLMGFHPVPTRTIAQPGINLKAVLQDRRARLTRLLQRGAHPVVLLNTIPATTELDIRSWLNVWTDQFAGTGSDLCFVTEGIMSSSMRLNSKIRRSVTSLSPSMIPAQLRQRKAPMLLWTRSSPDSPLKQSTRQFLKAPLMRRFPRHLDPKPFEDWVRRYPEDRRRDLAEAKESLENQPLTRKDALVKNFLKIECGPKPTDCRNISPRSDRFVSLVGPYISALEDACHKLPFLIKGLNIVARDKKMAFLAGMRNFLEVDFHRLDASITIDILRDVQDQMMNLPFLSPAHDAFRAALRLAHITIGRSEYGTRYKVPGTRCSGDTWTSIGNALICAHALWLYTRSKHQFHEGDDCVAQSSHPMLGLGMWCLGLQPKIIRRKCISAATFCGRCFGYSDLKIRSFCDINRFIIKFHTTIADGLTSTLALAKALSYLSTDNATPIVSSLCHLVVRCLRERVSIKRLERVFDKQKHKIRWLSSSEGKHEALSWLYRVPKVDVNLYPYVALTSGISIDAASRCDKYFSSLSYIPQVFPVFDVPYPELKKNTRLVF